MDKNLSITKHFNRRAMERLGFPLNRKVRNIIIKKIQKGECILLVKQSLTRTIYKIIIDDELRDYMPSSLEYLIVVYNSQRHKLITILNPYYSDDGDMWKLNLPDETIVGVVNV
jgi:hypothetical protein